MHHSSEGWHGKMRKLAEAIAEGKRAYLVNTVWQDNGPEYDDVLRKLDGIWVREIASQKDLRDRHGIESFISPDVSIFYRETSWFSKNFRGEPVMTDFWSEEFRNFAVPRIGKLRELQHIKMKGSWGSFVKSLRTAPFIATGRHHAVYAACQARVPFAAMEGNTHKISGLIQTAGVNIPVAKTISEIPNIIASIDANRGQYEALFDWLASQKGEDALPKSIGTPLVPGRS